MEQNPGHSLEPTLKVRGADVPVAEYSNSPEERQGWQQRHHREKMLPDSYPLQ